MYIVRDTKTKKVIHINPAPLVQNLSNTEVYFKFDPGKMEIGKTDGYLPEYFDINEREEIVELTLKDMVERGFMKIEPHQKMENNRIVDKTVSELVGEGLLNIPSDRKMHEEMRKLKGEYKALKKELMEIKDKLSK